MKHGFSMILSAMMFLAAAGEVGARADDAAASDQITFTRDIMPIFQKNCADCHRPAGTNLAGMIAPMSLMTYQEVRPWVKSIAEQVKSRAMPPWDADPQHHGVFRNERTLTEEEIAKVVRWAQSGAPMGSPELAPPVREFPNTDGWSIGKPDLVVGFDEPYFVKDDVVDLYKNITVQLTEEMLPEDKWIKSLEFRAGSPVVHHIIGYQRLPEDYEAVTETTTRGMIGGMAPGSDAPQYPDGFGMKLVKGSSIVFQMHYHKEAGEGTGVEDLSEVAFIFHDKPVTNEVTINAISNGRFEIPPHVSGWKVGMGRTFEEDIIILGLTPHSHLRGSRARYTAYYPDGTTELLLHVPKYDFNWQTQYTYKEPKVIPAGTRIEAEMWYENDEARQAIAPEVDPTRPVRFGGPTTDEMDLAWMNYAPAKQLVADAR